MNYGSQSACVQLFVKMYGEMERLSSKLNYSAKEMIKIINSDETDEDEKMMALNTLVEVFFPGEGD